MNSKYFKSSCKKCNWNLTVRQSVDEFCIRPSGLFRFLANKIPKACPKCGSELQTQDASFWNYASPIQCVKRIINGKRQLLELLKNRPK